jgi:carbamoylphosphate synthase large subunit
MKKILLLGGSAQQVIAIETAKRLGYYTVLCDFLIDNPGQYVADKFYLVSTTDKKAILEVAQKENVNGVLAYASDPAAPTAAYVTEMMGLSGNPYESVEILCNKDKFRFFLKQNGFHAPESKNYHNIESAMNDYEIFQYPLIVKPVDSSGSKGATVLHSGDKLKEALEFAFSFSRCHRVIVEDFIERKHPYLIGGDIFIVNGEIVLWGLLNCHRDSVVNPLVPVGKSYPLELVENDINCVKDTLRSLVKKLDIRNGSMNVELIIDKMNRVWPIDIGPRSGGNMIPDLLGDMFNLSIAEMSIQVAIGQEIKENIEFTEGYYATHNLHTDKYGSYKIINFDTELNSFIYRKFLYKKTGDSVEYFNNASKCLGIIFMKFPSKEKMYDVMKRITDLYTVELL